MSSQQPDKETETEGSTATTWTGPRKRWVPIVVLVSCTLAAVVLTWLLTTIFSHKQEAERPFTQVVELTDKTYDPKVWGQSFPGEYEGHLATNEMAADDKVSRKPTAEDPREFTTHSKLAADPRLVTMWQGYAFAKDYREPRGHEWMLTDQKYTERMRVAKQPGACLNCHASMPQVYDALGNGDRNAGFAKMNALPYAEAAKHAGGPLACIDCHDPKTMALRVTRPAFANAMVKLKEGQGIKGYNVNRDATNQEMRSFVCAQCHVEYYFKGKEKTLTFPWDKGLTVNDAMAYYDEAGFTDFEHKDTKAPILKAQHPDFETWSNGTHAANGVGCADCHMSYERKGAAKITNHQIASPMRDDNSINASCMTCHHSSPGELKAKVATIHDRWNGAKNITFDALDQLIADLTKATKEGGATPEQLTAARDFQRKAQFIVDYSVSENSRGFHAPAYSIAILNQATDYARKGQLVLRGVDVKADGPVTTASPKPKS